MEKWDIYDRHRVPTGKVINRGDALGANAFHLVVHVCIIDTQDRLLIQQRQTFKEGWPNMWDVTTGGSALAGETSEQAAEREVFEEIGYRIDLGMTRPVFTIHFSQGFDDFYVVRTDINIERLRLQQEEVQAVKWASRDQVMAAIEDRTFIPYHRSVIDMIFDMKDTGGAHTY